ncbi:hypothetical protein BJ742DRAFT_833150 [Cladochytrium replicatum]|nr:hypothetical protein BJ742DRAFT_833150 [Cladochytrium replicatum]
MLFLQRAAQHWWFKFRRNASTRTSTSTQSPSMTSMAPPPGLVTLLLVYHGALSAASFGLFAYDKHQATNKGWRVRERTLQLTALLGGWAGGMVAMKTFRHKTIKQSFQQGWAAATAGHFVVCIGAAAAWAGVPGLRAAGWRVFGNGAGLVQQWMRLGGVGGEGGAPAAAMSRPTYRANTNRRHQR